MYFPGARHRAQVFLHINSFPQPLYGVEVLTLTFYRDKNGNLERWPNFPKVMKQVSQWLCQSAWVKRGFVTNSPQGVVADKKKGLSSLRFHVCGGAWRLCFSSRWDSGRQSCPSTTGAAGYHGRWEKRTRQSAFWGHMFLLFILLARVCHTALLLSIEGGSSVLPAGRERRNFCRQRENLRRKIFS